MPDSATASPPADLATSQKAFNAIEPMPDAIDQLVNAALAGLPTGRLVVGFSGGPDSTALLHVLSHLPAARERGVRAIHVDHGLQADSAAWASRCEALARDWDIVCTVVRVAVRPTGDGLENAARRARWQAFAQTLAADEILVLGHHRDDQAETVLLRLLRGAGAAGLAAMRPWRERRNGLRVWRPLLSTSRARIADWVQRHELACIDDPANRDPRHDRSWLRDTVMPLLQQRWPSMDSALALSAARLADAHALENQVARALLATASGARADELMLAPLRAVDRVQRWAALRRWLALHGTGDVGANRLATIDRELIAAAIDATPRIDLGACVLRRHRDRLYALAPDTDQPLTYRLEWNGCAPLALPGNAGTLSIEPVPAEPLPLTVATRTGGERLRLHREGPHRLLKHLLQEAGIPPWLRERWPVLWLDAAPAAFADRLLDHRLAQRLTGRRLRFDP